MTQAKHTPGPFGPIDPCFFEGGQYEVWAAKTYDGGSAVVKICGGLSLQAAKKFNWPRKEIRLNAKPISIATKG